MVETDTDTGTNSQDSLQAGKDSDPQNTDKVGQKSPGEESREFKFELNDIKRKYML